MQTEVSVGETDDPYFIALLNSMVRGLASRSVPDEFWIIKIDNWFDHKWLRFSGIGAVDFQWPTFLNRWDGALSEFYQDRVTFPPFTPAESLASGRSCEMMITTSRPLCPRFRTNPRNNRVAQIF